MIQWMPVGDFLSYHVNITSISKAKNSLGKGDGWCLFMMSNFSKLIELGSLFCFFYNLKIILLICLVKKKMLLNKSGSNNWINNYFKTYEFSILCHLCPCLTFYFKMLVFIDIFYAGNYMV